MLLAESEVQQAVAQAKVAFPRFDDWEYSNEVDELHFGFSIWGQLVLDPENDLPKCFFITLDTYEEAWYGHLTIGQHCYLWSSADMGDAHLVDTEPCDTLGEAITALKMRMRRLCEVLSVG